MRSEFQFLQSEVDEREFVDAFSRQADALEKESPTQWLFRVGDCRIQFLRSRRSSDQISLGRIALATHGFDLSFSSAPQAEALYKKMRTWLKKRYVNKLTAENIAYAATVTSYRMMWLGPDARARYRSGAVSLRTIFDSRVIVKEEPNQSPEPTAMSVTPPAAQESRQP